MNRHRPDGNRRRTLRGSTVVLTAVAKAIVGVILAVLTLASWHQVDTLAERHRIIDAWSDTGDYAVFYPHLVGDDRAEFESGSHTTTIVEARDLYPILDEAGALFIDAHNYREGIPNDPPHPMPVWPITVNTNYLEQYPILDEVGVPIVVERDERDWVVAVPEQYRPLEAELQTHFRESRVGGADFDGAVQGQENFLGEPVPDGFRDQQVRIIWTASDQQVFSFDSTVNPGEGNMIVDPIVQIMTPANSLTVDRMNAITGSIDPAMKVRVDGDPATVFRDLAPLLERLNLDDNLQHLVTGQEAILGEVAEIRESTMWTVAFAVAALLVLLASGVTLIAGAADRMRRTLIVRRLHGFGLLRAHRGLFGLLGATWTVQALIASLAVMAVTTMNSGQMPGDEVSPLAEMPRLWTILGAIGVAEVLVAVVTIGVIERRHAVERLKEL